MAGTRQLAAIMITAIDGYDAMMRQDESSALQLVRTHREVLQKAASDYHGKILQKSGHNSLSLFNSAVEAVQCAIQMQLDFRKDTPVPVKIGIHLGDIMYTEDEAHGDGIVVARQISNQALPGGILISNKIYEEVKNQTGIISSYLKACELDEEGQRVEVYAITNEGIAVPEGVLLEGGPSTGLQGSGSWIRHFWDEARRRNVARVIAMYAGTAFVIIELTNNISEPLGLPRWLPTVVILLLIIGFPVTAILSWIFDFTPDGIRKTQPAKEYELVARQEAPAQNGNWFRRNKILGRYIVPTTLLALLVGFYFFKDRMFQNWERVNRVAREHTEKANLYLQNNADPDLIRQELDLALEADPDYDSALYTYATLHRLQGDTVRAKQKLHMVLESDPGYSNAWDQLATFAFLQDSFELAMGYSIMAMEADPGNYIAAYNLALQSEDRGLYEQAVAYFERSIQMDSTFVRCYSALGALFNKMNRPTDAIFTLHKSLRISPASAFNFLIYKNLAEAHFILKEYDKAFEYLEQSKVLNPDYPETEKCYARYYEATGAIEEAILHWRRYLALEDEALELQQAQQHLDSIRVHPVK